MTLVVAAALAPACGGAQADDAPATLEESQDELARAIVRGVVAVGLERGPHSGQQVIGAKSKVRKVMSAFRTGERTAFCAAPSETRMTLWDKEGDVLGNVRLECFKGTLTLADGRTKAVSISPSDLRVFDEAPVVGDSLWAIDKIKIARQRERAKTITDADAIAHVIAGFGLDQEIADAVSARCMLRRSIAFYRKGREVASATYACAESSVGLERAVAHYEYEDRTDDPEVPAGLIHIDASRIEELF